VNTTDSSTHWCKKIPAHLEKGVAWWLLLCALLVVVPQGVQAQVLIPERLLESKVARLPAPEIQVAREADGLFLTVTLPPATLSAQVLAALDKGIPMVFTLQAQVVLPRWYWSDKVLAQARRHVRLSYQPLTRRWRLTQAFPAFSSAGVSGVSSEVHTGLGQTFDDVSQALAAMQRIVHWRIAPGEVARQSSAYVVKFQFRLDVSQLPRLLQIGTAGHQGWALQWTRSVPVPALGASPDSGDTLREIAP